MWVYCFPTHDPPGFLATTVLGPALREPVPYPNRGLADLVPLPLWAPSTLADTEHEKSSQFVCRVLIVLYAAYFVAAIILSVRQRITAPVSLARSAEETQFAMPYLTVCLPRESSTLFATYEEGTKLKHYLIGQCCDPKSKYHCKPLEEKKGSMDDGTVCWYEEWNFKSKDNLTCVTYRVTDSNDKNVEIGAVEPAVDIDIALEPVPDMLARVIAFASDNRPDEDTEIHKSRPGLYENTSLNQLKITKQTINDFEVSYWGWKKKDISSVLYAVNSSTEISSDKRIRLHCRTSPLGTETITRIDPVDFVSLLGSLGGASVYVSLFFTLMCGGAMLKKRREVERKFIIHVTNRTPNQEGGHTHAE
ncbi:unnamed protein product [Chrysoparadoxa australica]